MSKTELRAGKILLLNNIVPNDMKQLDVHWEIIDMGETSISLSDDKSVLHAGNMVGVAKIKATAISKIINAPNIIENFDIYVQENNDSINEKESNTKENSANKRKKLEKILGALLGVLLGAILSPLFTVLFIHDHPEIELIRAYVPLAIFNEEITGLNDYPVIPRFLNHSLDHEIRNMDNDKNVLVGVIFIRVLGLDEARVNNFTLSMTEYKAYDSEVPHLLEWTTTVRNDNYLMFPMFITNEFNHDTDLLALRVDEIWSAKRQYPQYQPNYITYDIVALDRPILSLFKRRTRNLPPIQQAPAQRRITTRNALNEPSQGLPPYIWILGQ